MDGSTTGGALPLDTTRTLAGWVAQLRFEDLDSEVVDAAKRQAVDTLSVAWRVRAQKVSIRCARSLSQRGAPEARVWCYGDRLPATQAAFVNGMLASALDYDSLHDRANVHTDGVVVPAVLAVADARGATGAQVITAMVAGSELMVRLGLATTATPVGSIHQCSESFGAAAATCNLLGLDETHSASARYCAEPSSRDAAAAT